MSIVKSYSLGSGDIRGDMFYIKHNSTNFTVIDCYLNEKDGREDEIIQEIISESQNRICRFISTHPDNDHILGIEKLDEAWPIINFYAVNNNINADSSDDSLTKYINLKADHNYAISKGIKRAYLNQEGTTDTGEQILGSGLNFYRPDLNNEKFQKTLAKLPDRVNNICPIFTYNVESSATFMWMGDLETDMQQEYYNNNIGHIPGVDILFAPHHGRKSGEVPPDLLKALNPKIIVIGDAPSEHIHYYDSEKTITQNSAGDIYFECLDNKVRIFTKNKISNVPKVLKQEFLFNPKGWFYIGTLKINTVINSIPIFTTKKALDEFYSNRPMVD